MWTGLWSRAGALHYVQNSQREGRTHTKAQWKGEIKLPWKGKPKFNLRKCQDYKEHLRTIPALHLIKKTILRFPPKILKNI